MGLKEGAEMLQQLVYRGAVVKVWIDGKFATVLTVEEADGQVAITTIHNGDPSQKRNVVADDTVFSVALPTPTAEKHEEGKEAVSEGPYGD